MTSGKEALLVLVQDGENKQTWSLAGEVTTIGRWEDNDVVIPDRWVSRYHAEIRRLGTRHVLCDLGSKNGLFVNGQRVDVPLPLEDGDQIQIAPHCQLVFVDSEATAPVFRSPSGVLLDVDTRQVWVMGQELDPPLSSAQFALLQALVEQPGHVFEHDDLTALVWPDEDPAGISDEAVNSLVRRLRKRLTEIDPSHRYIYAVRGHGIKFEQP